MEKNRVRNTTLENGLRVVTQAMPSVRSVSIGVIVDAGPHSESEEQSGLAHLTEHLMFQGTSSRDAGQIARLMDMGGGSMGGFTTRDYTCYYATVLDDYRTYALDLLGDIFLNSTFPPDHLEREKEAILREIDMGQDTPMARVNDVLKSYTWPDHPLGRPVTGRPETVRPLMREDVIYFFHERYLPNRMTIAAAGNVEHEDFVAQVRDAFWRMLGEAPAPTHVAPTHRDGVVVEPMPVSQAYFSMGIPVYPYAHPDRYGLHVLNNVLGGGISSRIFRRIRDERGMVFDIGSEYHAYRDAGMLVVEGSTAPEYLISVLALTLVEMWKLFTGDEPIGEEELWKAHMQIRGQHLIAAESTHTCMSRLTTQMFYFGHHIPSGEILDEIEAVDHTMLQRMAEETLVDALRQVTVAVVGPEAPEAYSRSAIEELLAEFA
jgi:predicted Zn-dependent peptidase